MTGGSRESWADERMNRLNIKLSTSVHNMKTLAAWRSVDRTFIFSLVTSPDWKSWQTGVIRLFILKSNQHPDCGQLGARCVPERWIQSGLRLIIQWNHNESVYRWESLNSDFVWRAPTQSWTLSNGLYDHVEGIFSSSAASGWAHGISNRLYQTWSGRL